MELFETLKVNMFSETGNSLSVRVLKFLYSVYGTFESPGLQIFI